MDKWRAIDVNEVVFNIVDGKPEAIKDNYFVNRLYDNYKLDKERGLVKQPITVLLFADLHIDY